MIINKLRKEFDKSHKDLCKTYKEVCDYGNVISIYHETLLDWLDKKFTSDNNNYTTASSKFKLPSLDGMIDLLQEDDDVEYDEHTVKIVLQKLGNFT